MVVVCEATPLQQEQPLTSVPKPRIRVVLADRMFVVGAYVARPRYATSEGCVG